MLKANLIIQNRLKATNRDVDQLLEKISDLKSSLERRERETRLGRSAMDEKICHLQKRVDQMRLDLDDQESIL
jgi:dynactin complex subunit